MNNSFDNLIRDSFNEELSVMPDSDIILCNIKNKIKENKNKKRRQLVLCARTAFLIIICLLVTIPLLKDVSYGDYIRKMIQINNNDEIIYSNNNPGEVLKDYNEKEILIEEAQNNVYFDLKFPSYIAKGYSLNKVIIQEWLKDKTVSLECIYADNTRLLLYTQIPIDRPRSQSLIINKDITKAEKINIGDREYNIIIDEKTNHTELFWDENEILYILFGNINKDEIIKMAESIK